MDEHDDDIQLGERLIHIGYRPERTIYDGGDLESAFADAWWEQFERRGDGHLQLLLGSGKFGDKDITQRDAHVAATIIQWIGTNCGWGFFCEVLRKHGQYEIIDTHAEKALADLERKANE